jgi:RNA polymerase sigma-70 factor (ECF subfamily)
MIIIVKFYSVDFSLSDIYNEYWKLLYDIAYAKTGSRQDAFDIVQDLFVHIWEKRRKIAAVSLKAYLLTSLRNRIFDHFRKNGVRENILADFQGYVDPTIMNEAELQESAREDAEKFLHHAVEELPEKMRYIVQQRWFHKKTIADISIELSLSHQTVKNNLSMALQRIRKHAEEHAVDIVFLLPVIALSAISR